MVAWCVIAEHYGSLMPSCVHHSTAPSSVIICWEESRCAEGLVSQGEGGIYYTLLKCASVNLTALYYTTLQYITLHWTKILGNVLHLAAIHRTKQCCPMLYCTTLYSDYLILWFANLHIILNCTSLHCSVLCYCVSLSLHHLHNASCTPPALP